MKYSVQILGAGATDCPPSLLFMFDSQRYLINCGEGTQRYCTEHKIRLPKLKNIFFSRLHWETVGGLPGMLLTLSDATAESMPGPIQLHGPPNMHRLLASFRHFIYAGVMNFNIVERSADTGQVVPELADENMTVQSVLLVPGQDQDHAERGQGDVGTGVVNGVIDDLPERFSKWMQRSKGPRQQPPVKGDTASLIGKPFSCSVAYVFRGPEVPGKFDINAAKTLGLKPGPMFGQLQRGQAVALVDGRVIQPSDVVGPAKPSQLFSVLDLPTIDHVREAHSSSQLATLLDHGNPQNVIAFHMVGKSVAHSPEFAALLQDATRFHPSTRHFFIGPDFAGEPVSFTSSGVTQSMFNVTVPGFFPVYQQEPARSSVSPVANLPNVTLAKPLTNIGIEPKYVVEPMEHAKKADILATAARLIASNDKLRGHTSDMDVCAPITSDDGDWVVVPLGTGSAIPSIFRNVSSTLISTPAGPILLDCGEGTMGQLSRLLPVDSDSPGAQNPPTNLVQLRHPTLQHLLSSLRLVFISHLHADHHLGLARILSVTDHPITIIGPWRLWNYLRELDSFHPVKLQRVTFVDAADLLIDPEAAKAAQTAGKGYRGGGAGKHKTDGPRTVDAKVEKESEVSPSAVASVSADAFGPKASDVKRNADATSVANQRKRSRSPTSPDRRPTTAGLTSAKADDAAAVSTTMAETELDRPMDDLVLSPLADGLEDIATLPRTPDRLQPLFDSYQLASMHTTVVVHRSFSYALRLVSSASPDLSLVFSGDTRPTDRLVQLGRAGGLKPQLLIHEATFESEMVDEAKAKLHSTTAEAVTVFERMGAKNLLLTHFSQRYPKMPKIEKAIHPENIAIAFDLMALPLRKVSGLQEYASVVSSVCRQQAELARLEEAGMGGGQ